jgi:CRISPR-associated protein Csh1
MRDYILSRLTLIQERIKKNDVKAGKYVKVFCEAAMEDYVHASDLYLIPKIFNKNDYNIEIGDKIFGLSNFNMGTNSKKPFLEHKTTAYIVPFRISLEDALDGYRLSAWLNSQNIEGKSIDSGYLTFGKNSGCYLQPKVSSGEAVQYIHFTRGKTGPVIDDYEILPQPKKELDKPLKVYNYLRIPKYDVIIVKEMDMLEKTIDEYFFNGNMIRGYFYSPSIKEGYFTSRQSALLHMYRDAFKSFFLKFDDSSLRRIVDKCTLGLVIEQLKLSDTMHLEKTRFAKALNLRFVLLEYFEIGGKEKMGSIVNDLFSKVKSKADMIEPKAPLICETDEEFYFAAGQLARYLLSLSRAQKVNYSLINPLLKANNSSKLKDELNKLIQKYGHDIEVWSSGMRSRFDNLQSMVNSYNCKSGAMADMLLAGFAAPNIIYMRKEEEN